MSLFKGANLTLDSLDGPEAQRDAAAGQTVDSAEQASIAPGHARIIEAQVGATASQAVNM